MASTSSPSIPNSKRRKLDEDSLDAIQHHLPECVIKELLVRLPVKSILKFKSVCKSWYSLFQSRYFIDCHRGHRLLHDDHRNKLFFSRLGKLGVDAYTTDFSSSSNLSESTPLFDLEVLLEAVKGLNFDEIMRRIDVLLIRIHRCLFTEMFEPNIKVVGPLKNGIYCVIAESDVEVGNEQNIFKYGLCNPAICNPATREFKLISPPSRVLYQTHKQYYGFCSIQKASDAAVVVDYKIVVISQAFKAKGFRVFLYSLRLGGWQQFRWMETGYNRHEIHSRKALAAFLLNDKLQFPTITQDLDFLPQAFVNGSCHWMAGNSVLQFDMTKEVFGSFPGPPKDYCNLPYPRSVKRGVFAFNDQLFAIFIICEFVPGVFIQHEVDVWMMKEYGVAKSWTKIHSSKFQYKGEFRKFLGMLFSKESQGIDKMFFQDKLGVFLSYDCSTYIIRTMKKDNAYNSSWICWKAVGLSEYCETLEPVSLDVHA